MNIKAPVLISVYDRANHLKRCIDSLKQCKESVDTDIYIVSDAAFREEDEEKIRVVRDYVNSIDGFRNVYKIFRKENMGVPHSVKEAYKEVIRKYKRIIFMEDDIVVSPNFLEYMNAGLDMYEDDSRIFSISGYCPPVDIPKDYKHDIFLCRRFNPWGYGTWLDRKDKYKGHDPDNKDVLEEEIKEVFKDKKYRKKFREIGNDILIGLMTWSRDYYPGDFVNCYHIVKNDLYCVSPVVSKTNNIGFDGSGVHCDKNESFVNPVLDDSSRNGEMIRDIHPDSRINKKIKSYYTTVKHDIKYLLYKTKLLKFL